MSQRKLSLKNVYSIALILIFFLLIICQQFGGLNIDDGDEENALLVCEYVNDIYAYKFDMERKYAIRKNHLEGQMEVHPRMRTVLLDWISEVHTQYHFAQETFHLAVSLIDRYLQVINSFHAFFPI